MTDLIKYFPFLAIIGFVVPFWNQSKNFAIKIFRMIWKKRQIPSGLSFCFYKKLTETSKLINLDDYHIDEASFFNSKEKKYQLFALKRHSVEIFLFKKFVPIFIFGGSNDTIFVQYLKYTFNFEKFLKRVTMEYHDMFKDENLQKECQDRFQVLELRGRSLKFIGDNKISHNQNESAKGSFNTSSEAPNKYYTIQSYHASLIKKDIIIGFDIKDYEYYRPADKIKDKYFFTQQGEFIFNQVRKWVKSENWYTSKNIIYKRGCLLYGAAGTGKSTLILEIAKKLGIPIYIFHLGSFDDFELDQKINEMGVLSGIVLFEDIDNIWNGRENLQKNDKFGGVSFDFFLNKLSGVKSIQNKYIFITTNHIEKLDPALLRDGRMDEKIELSSLNLEEKFKVADVILDSNMELINKVMETGATDTTAEFENRCVRLSLQNFWSDNKNLTSK